MKIESVSAVLFYSPEPAQLASFYRAHLGIPFEPDRHGAAREHLECDIGHVHLAVLKGHRPQAPRTEATGVAPTFGVGDLDAFVQALGRAGVAPSGSILDLGEGRRVAQFRDPDGNSFQLIEHRA
jgi:predicted enzyme related to lactoylglutathione lyase